MSAISRIADGGDRGTRPRAKAEAGFTLLEILVVLAIGALVVATVIPAMGRVVDAVTYDSELQDVVGQLDQLGFRAFTSGKPIVLADGTPQTIAAAGLNLPRAWSLSITQPLHFNSLGMCDGGSVTVTSPDGRTTSLRLAPPDCATRPATN